MVGSGAVMCGSLLRQLGVERLHVEVEAGPVLEPGLTARPARPAAPAHLQQTVVGHPQMLLGLRPLCLNEHCQKTTKK